MKALMLLLVCGPLICGAEAFPVLEEPGQSPAASGGDAADAEVDITPRKVTYAKLSDLKKMTSLERLQFRGAEFTDRDLAGLGWVEDLFGSPLGAVHLIGPGITDDGLKVLEKLNSLHTLHLIRTEVTDVGLEYLEKHTDLKELYLHRVRGTDAGLRHLEGLTRLEVLFLTGPQVGDDGLEHLKGMMYLLARWATQLVATSWNSSFAFRMIKSWKQNSEPLVVVQP